MVVVIAVLGGCAQPPVRPMAQSPPYQFQPGTLRAIDEAILTASMQARSESEANARMVMEEWKSRVRQRIDEVFIPWYFNFGIQQWISTKVVVYKLMYTEGDITPEERLVSYLQEQFYEQVLQPVSRSVDPQTVMEDAAVDYLRELRGRLGRLPSQYHIPASAFWQHLKTIPAITVQEVPPQQASLYEVLQAAHPTAVPAYRALLGEVAATSDIARPTPPADRLRVVADQAVSRMLDSMALRGGTTTASSLVGGVWGMALSAGSTAYAAIDDEREKPEREARMREDLNAVLDLMWQELVEDPHGGVTALVDHISSRIDDAVVRPHPSPLSEYRGTAVMPGAAR